MPLPDLSLATAAIRNLIESRASIAYSAVVDVTIVSPQEDNGSMNPSVNVYLFHIIEDAHYKNQPQRNGSGPIPIQHVPIGLNLHYVVTVRVPESETRVESEHKLLGIVAKIIHDFPIVTQDVLTEEILGENRFDLILRPVSLEETINFWAGDDTHITRPSLFLEARVIQLEPEPPQILPGIVLTLGTFVFAGRGPRVVTSRNQLAFVPPGFGVQRVSAEPARVALHAAPFPATTFENNNRLTLVGSGFGRGHRFLELARIGDTEDDRVRVIDLEPNPPPADDNDDWAFDIRPDSISLSFITTVFDAAGAEKEFIPGLYTARVVLEEEPRRSVSNQIVFAVVPQITGIADTAAANVFTLTISGAYLESDDVELVLVVGDQVFTEAVSPDNPGQYTIDDGDSLTFHIPAPTAEDFPIPVNLTVNGAQATPAWVAAP
ncbi:MAG TPA: DUF4255 domain-containing protein [Polyangiaceae bacterium]|nr:DUF4255 domain-containing protein [Polyangiaceae bacterium]